MATDDGYGGHRLARFYSFLVPLQGTLVATIAHEYIEVALALSGSCRRRRGHMFSARFCLFLGKLHSRDYVNHVPYGREELVTPVMLKCGARTAKDYNAPPTFHQKEHPCEYLA